MKLLAAFSSTPPAHVCHLTSSLLPHTRHTLLDLNLAKAIWHWQLDRHRVFNRRYKRVRWNITLAVSQCLAQPRQILQWRTAESREGARTCLDGGLAEEDFIHRARDTAQCLVQRSLRHDRHHPQVSPQAERGKETASAKRSRPTLPCITIVVEDGRAASRRLRA